LEENNPNQFDLFCPLNERIHHLPANITILKQGEKNSLKPFSVSEKLTIFINIFDLFFHGLFAKSVQRKRK